jgi:hypothetical protein
VATGLPSVLAPATVAALGGHLGPNAIFFVLALVCAAPLVWLLAHRSALRVSDARSG